MSVLGRARNSAEGCCREQGGRNGSGAVVSTALVKGKRDDLLDPSGVIHRHVSPTQLQYLLCKEKCSFSDFARMGQASIADPHVEMLLCESGE